MLVRETYPPPCPFPARGEETLSISHRPSHAEYAFSVSLPLAGRGQGWGYSFR